MVGRRVLQVRRPQLEVGSFEIDFLEAWGREGGDTAHLLRGTRAEHLIVSHQVHLVVATSCLSDVEVASSGNIHHFLSIDVLRFHQGILEP